MCKLSIIVPIYNVERYLPRCIESILCQTLQDFELILVEDGSPDRSGVIIDNYAKLDDRIIAIHQTNKGVSAARNAGLKIARGEYIGFVDPDDWIENSMYSKMVDILDDNDGDLAFCNWDIFQDTNGIQECHLMPDFPESMTEDDFFCHVFDTPRTVGGAVWNKIIRKDIIRCYFDENYRIGEDWLFLTQICTNRVKVFYCPKVLYHFVSHMGSATHQGDWILRESFAVRRLIVGISEKMNSKCRMSAEKGYVDAGLRYFHQLKCSNNSMLFEIRNNLYSYLSSNIKTVSNNKYMSNRMKIVCAKWLVEQYIYIYIAQIASVHYAEHLTAMLRHYDVRCETW